MGSSGIFFAWGAALHPHNCFQIRSAFAAVHPATVTDPLVASFEAALAADLAELQRTEGSCLSLNWLSSALKLCLDTHSRLDQMFPHIQKAFLQSGLDDILEDTLQLLDATEALRDAIAEMKDYSLVLQILAQALTRGPLTATKLAKAQAVLATRKRNAEALRLRLENCASSLRKISRAQAIYAASVGTAQNCELLEVVKATMCTTVFVYGVIVSALSSKSKRALASPPAFDSAWAVALKALHKKVREEMETGRSKGCRSLVAEVDSAEVAAHDLMEVVERCFCSKKSGVMCADKAVCEAAEELKRRLRAVDECRECLETHVGRVFRVLVTTRMALLDIVSYS